MNYGSSTRYGLTWYLQWEIYTSNPTWTHSQNSIGAAEALNLKIPFHGTYLKWSWNIFYNKKISKRQKCLSWMKMGRYSSLTTQIGDRWSWRNWICGRYFVDGLTETIFCCPIYRLREYGNMVICGDIICIMTNICWNTCEIEKMYCLIEMIRQKRRDQIEVKIIQNVLFIAIQKI